MQQSERQRQRQLQHLRRVHGFLCAHQLMSTVAREADVWVTTLATFLKKGRIRTQGQVAIVRALQKRGLLPLGYEGIRVERRGTGIRRTEYLRIAKELAVYDNFTPRTGTLPKAQRPPAPLKSVPQAHRRVIPEHLVLARRWRAGEISVTDAQRAMGATCYQTARRWLRESLAAAPEDVPVAMGVDPFGDEATELPVATDGELPWGEDDQYPVAILPVDEPE